MKKVIILIVLGVLMSVVMAHAEIYPQVMMVTNVNSYDDVITLVDLVGNEWIIEEDPEDIMVGDILGVIMDDCETECIYDDVIIEWRYCGYVEMWAQWFNTTDHFC